MIEPSLEKESCQIEVDLTVSDPTGQLHFCNYRKKASA